MSVSDVSSLKPTTISTQRRRIGLLLVVAMIAGTGLAWVLDRHGLRTFSGSIEAKKTLITTNHDALVQEVSVKVGQTVVSGDALLKLADADLEDRLASKKREIVQFEAELAKLKAASDVELAWRRREIQTEVFQTQMRVAALAQEKLSKEVEHLAWKERLNRTQAAPVSAPAPRVTEGDGPFRKISMEMTHAAPADDRRIQAMLREDSAAAAVEALTTQIALCDQQLNKLDGVDRNLDLKIRTSMGVDVAEARLIGAKAELAKIEDQVKDLSLTSPTYGTIGDVKPQPGDRVPGGRTLIEILDDQQPHVVAQIPSDAAASVRPGSKVTLVFPTQERRSGIVASIPPQATTAAGSNESVLPIRIEPAGKLWPKLAIGSNVKVLLQ